MQGEMASQSRYPGVLTLPGRLVKGVLAVSTA